MLAHRVLYSCCCSFRLPCPSTRNKIYVVDLCDLFKKSCVHNKHHRGNAPKPSAIRDLLILSSVSNADNKQSLLPYTLISCCKTMSCFQNKEIKNKKTTVYMTNDIKSNFFFIASVMISSFRYSCNDHSRVMRYSYKRLRQKELIKRSAQESNKYVQKTGRNNNN